MLPKIVITLLALMGLTVCSATAQAQFGPAIGPPTGFVPSGPSGFPPLTIPAPPPGWIGTAPTPSTPAPHQVFKIYYRVSPSAPWKYYCSANKYSDAVWMANCLRAAGYGAFVQ